MSDHLPAMGLAEARTEREFRRLMGSGDTEAKRALLDHISVDTMLQALPVAIYTTDALGKITFYNEAAAKLWGHRPSLGTDEWCGSWKLYWPDGTFLSHGECPMAMALRDGRAIHGMEAAAERPDGTLVPFLAFPTPFFGPDGKVTGAVNMLVDISERKRDEAAAQRLAAIVECSDDAIISKDLNGVIMSWNDGARRLFGYSEEEALGQSITILIPKDRQHEEPEILARLRRGERIDHFETVRQRKDGSLVEISLCISPIVTTSGKVVGASKIARDISERKIAERYRDTLFAEMKHRVKNTLALAVSISNQTFHQAPAEERATFNARLQALGSAHDILSKHAWERASLNDVVTRTLAPHRTGEGRIHIAGPEIIVDAAKAVALSLVIHELATNAAKYGALSGDSGSVWVEWALVDGEAVRFEWRERGGPAVREPERHGFGTRLIERGLAAEFKNIGLAFQPEGVTCALEFSRL